MVSDTFTFFGNKFSIPNPVAVLRGRGEVEVRRDCPCDGLFPVLFNVLSLYN